MSTSKFLLQSWFVLTSLSSKVQLLREKLDEILISSTLTGVWTDFTTVITSDSTEDDGVAVGVYLQVFGDGVMSSVCDDKDGVGATDQPVRGLDQARVPVRDARSHDGHAQLRVIGMIKLPESRTESSWPHIRSTGDFRISGINEVSGKAADSRVSVHHALRVTRRFGELLQEGQNLAGGAEDAQQMQVCASKHWILLLQTLAADLNHLQHQPAVNERTLNRTVQWCERVIYSDA